MTASLGPHGGLRGGHAAVTAGYHLSKRHWNTVTLDGFVPDDEMLELIGPACDLVGGSRSAAAVTGSRPLIAPGQLMVAGPGPAVRSQCG